MDLSGARKRWRRADLYADKRLGADLGFDVGQRSRKVGLAGRRRGARLAKRIVKFTASTRDLGRSQGGFGSGFIRGRFFFLDDVHQCGRDAGQWTVPIM